MLNSYIEVDEAASRATICALVQNPASPDCPIGFSAQVAFISYSRSASRAVTESFYDNIVLPSFLLVSNDDYIDIAIQKLIDKCDNMTCLDVTIIHDNVVEINETFEVQLIAAPGLDRRISVDGSAEITIIDKDSEFHTLNFTLSLRSPIFSISQELLLVLSLQL